MQILLSSAGSQKSTSLNKDSKTKFEPVKATIITKGEHIIKVDDKSAANLP